MTDEPTSVLAARLEALVAAQQRITDQIDSILARLTTLETRLAKDEGRRESAKAVWALVGSLVGFGANALIRLLM